MISIGEMLIRILTQDETRTGLDSAQENVRAGMGGIQTTVTEESKKASRSFKDMAKTISAAGLSVAAIGGSITTVAVGLQNLGVLSEKGSKGITTFSMSMLVLGGVVSTVATVTRSYSTFLGSKFVVDVLAAAKAATTLQLALGVIGIAAVALVILLTRLDAIMARNNRSLEEMAKNSKTAANALSLYDTITASLSHELDLAQRELDSFNKELDDHEKKVDDVTGALQEWRDALKTIEDLNWEKGDAELDTEYARLALADEILDVREREAGVVDEDTRNAIQARRDELDIIKARRDLERSEQEPTSIAERIAEEEQKILDIKKEFGVESLEQLEQMLKDENDVVQKMYDERLGIIEAYEAKKREKEQAEGTAAGLRAYTQLSAWQEAGVPMSPEQKAQLMKLPEYAEAFAMYEREYESALDKWNQEPAWLKTLRELAFFANPVQMQTWGLINVPQKGPYADISIENLYTTNPKEVEEIQKIVENAVIVGINSAGGTGV